MIRAAQSLLLQNHLSLCQTNADKRERYHANPKDPDAAIRHAPADVVLIDNAVVGFDAGSFVRNDPFLDRSPKVMLLGMMTSAQLDQLCAQGKVWVFDAKDPSAAGILTFQAPWAADVAPLRTHLRQTGCAA